MKKLLLLAALASSSYAQSIKICANKTSGNLFLRPSCFGSERAITNLSALRGPQGPQGVPGSNVDMTKCHPASIEFDNMSPEDDMERPGARLFCPNAEFLVSYHWEPQQYYLQVTDYHFGDSVDPTYPIGDPTKPIRQSSAFGRVPVGDPSYAGDPYGSGTCCPLP